MNEIDPEIIVISIPIDWPKARKVIAKKRHHGNDVDVRSDDSDPIGVYHCNNIHSFKG
jgi:hypothetical protein